VIRTGLEGFKLSPFGFFSTLAKLHRATTPGAP
jgi:hypothetical protein